ncbi:fructose-6-phosphate aldolase [Cognatishimia maritima]|uniref:Transaldolase n=1 Tax=Cognatishimia maritima TaxID=870908 RepID=A0A1M5VGB3_9RHOB|nr:fructose-6-phosphate aldolase [Cognatishimia maritima]SHH74270.1 transaldolase [Cognatishimia maritima]
MKFFADTADILAIKKLSTLGLIEGVTTNPSLIAKSGRDILEVTREICEVVDGPVSAEVTALDHKTMMAEANVLKQIASNVCIKLPMTLDGLQTCRALSEQGVKTNVTLCFTVNQALLAAKAGATFVSPFVGRLDDIGLDGTQLVRDIRVVFANYDGLSTEILVASARTASHISQSAIIGADAVTAPPALIEGLADHPLTDKGLAGFIRDWESTGQSILSMQ